MYTALSTPFVDTRADDLIWTLGHPVLPSLLDRAADLGGCVAELRVLGASHQVLVYAGGLRLTETVACLPGVEGALPERACPDVEGLDSYTFSSDVLTLDPAAFAAHVDGVRETADRSGCGIAASFPGSPHAVTALLADVPGPRSVRWRTWHAYPQTGELVTTATTCVLSADGPRNGKEV